jgi:hypothetical protein
VSFIINPFILGGANPLLTNLVGFWKLEEASGSRIDASGNGKDLASNSGTPGNTTGKIGNAIQCTSASTQYVFRNVAADMRAGAGSMFISQWVKLDAIGARRGIVGKWETSGNNREYSLTYETTNQRFRFSVSNDGTGTAATVDANNFGAPSTGVYYHVVCGYNAATGKLWITVNNGVVNETNYTLGIYSAGTANFHVGRALASIMDGAIDAVGMWTRAPTASDIATLYNGGAGIEWPFSTHQGAALAITISQPTQYRVFQRAGTTGDIAISGLYVNGPHEVEARFNGGSWQSIGTGSIGYYSGTLTGQAQGQGTLEVRIASSPATTASVTLVGIGDIFIIAGQSNASGAGTNNQVYTHATLKAALFGNDYLWHDLIDPTDTGLNQVDTVSSDGSGGEIGKGTVWPLLATHFLASQGIPCAFVPCALGGSGIVAWLPGANHQNRATLYGSMVYRALQVGAKAILMWEGEANAAAGMSRATFNGHLDTIANALVVDTGAKLMPCKFQRCASIADADEDAINGAIGDAWADNMNVLTGPDLSVLSSDDDNHLKSDVNLAAAAALWWSSLQAAFGYG